MGRLNNIIICIVGKSGSGKSTVAEQLHNKYGYEILCSYTTRPPRHPNDTDHRYVDLQTFEALPNKVAYAEFDGNHYAALQHQVDESDIYIVDVAGLQQLKEKYKGDKNIVSIYIDTSMDTCLKHMRSRGDSEEACWKRLKFDDVAFKYAYQECNFCINGEDSIEGCCENIQHIINRYQIRSV